ncbi:hypothetical protein EWM64_g8290 [Hericium alpestre]|uniref:Peptidase C14 caspase domain-containing protein n=1 Tax=Hericium alpestre TaxID=135208 RepID=A0A4Y9ZLS3_9AGAM|nr:hypothetical protein EWM64_g8290 [Hericium alpestre]
MPPITPRKPQRRALLIGICYKHTHQDDWPELLLTHRDVDRFRALLRSRYDYADDEITVMKDDEAVPSRLWPTAQNIRRELDRLVRGTAAGDQLVLLFCGHSDQLDTEETKDKTEEDGQDEVIIACDAKRIVDNELKYRLVTSLHAGVNLTVRVLSLS